MGGCISQLQFFSRSSLSQGFIERGALWDSPISEHLIFTFSWPQTPLCFTHTTSIQSSLTPREKILYETLLATQKLWDIKIEFIKFVNKMKQVFDVWVQQYHCFPKEWFFGAPPSFNSKFYTEKRSFTMLIERHIPLMHSFTLNIYPGGNTGITLARQHPYF